MAIRQALTYFIMSAFLAAVGCRAPQGVSDPEYVRVGHDVHRSFHTPDVEAVAPITRELEGAQPVEAYVQYALGQNPKIQAARKRVEAAAHLVPVAASLQDPMLNVTVQPQSVQTASGEQEVVISANQKIPWSGKLETKTSIAESQANVARAKLASVELETISKVKTAYFSLYFVEKSIAITEEEQRLLGEIRDVADTRYRAGDTTQQDVLRADLEIYNVENELIRLRQQLVSARARLARELHVSPQTQLATVDSLMPEQLPSDLERLQRQAVAAHPDLHAQLAAIGRDRQAVSLARLGHKPDVTLGFSWIDVGSSGISPVANGRDAFLLTAGINLPVYKKRIASSVRAAEAQAVASARDYDAIRDVTIEEVTDLFSQARSQQELLLLFDEGILPKARLTLEASSEAYNVGQVDFLQLIDNWRQLLRYEIGYRRLEASLHQTLAELERAVGGIVVDEVNPNLESRPLGDSIR